MIAQNGAEAVQNAREFDSYSVGYCLKFVRAEAWLIGSLFGSAIDAWHGAVHRHPGDRHPPLGAPMFYAGGQYGHIVINTAEGRMRSTDCTWPGHVSEEGINWPVANWGQTYLGWTEDLNGVKLPLGEEEDEMTEDDWKRMRDLVREEVKEELNKQRPAYVSSILAGEVNKAGDTVKESLRLGLDHYRET